MTSAATSTPSTRRSRPSGGAGIRVNGKKGKVKKAAVIPGLGLHALPIPKKKKGQVKKVAYEDVVKSDDPTFNHKVAKGIFDAIMKMDDESARMYSYILVSDVLEETIEKNLPQLQRHLNEVIAKRMTEVKRATMRAVVKTQDGLPFAQALALFSKAIDWDEHLHPRSAGGQFRTKVTHAQTKPLHPKTAIAVGIQGTTTAKYKALTDEEKATYQDEYRQLANFLGAVHASSLNPGDSNVMLHFESNDGSQRWTEANNGTKVEGKLLNPKEHKLVGIEARPNTLTAGGAAFGLANALGSPRSQEFTQGVNYLDANLKGFANDWTSQPEGKTYNANEKLYGRVARGSGIVYDLAPPGSKLKIAARTAQFAGSHGPEAEQVFGPSARKTAYRYRGVTREPESDLVARWNAKVQNSKMGNIPVDISSMQMGAQRELARRRAPTDTEKIEARQEAINWLRSRQPNPRLFNLQLAAGNTPPSEGVLIDKNGKIVAQAVGYGDDHYLPFNLKQIGKLNGGEYIRSRSVGGLTTEDIYAGLMTGADRVTVTSRSGVFSVQFQPDLGGRKRAFNDKARRMTGRYAQLLDAVQSQQVEAMDVRPEVKAAIRAEVMTEMAGWGMKPSEINEVVRERVKEFKENPEFSEEDEKLISFLQSQDPRSMSMDAAALRTEIMTELSAEKEFKFRLNANGYKAALESLEEQFPYYIKSSVIPKKEQEAIHTELDRGYVAPGKNRPRAASAGIFGDLKGSGAFTMGGKFSAQEANYQSGTRGPGAPPPTVPGTPPAADKEAADKAAEVRRNIAGKRQGVAFAEAAAGVQQQVRNLGITEMTPEDRTILDYTAADLLEPSKQAKFEIWVNRLRALNVNLAEAGTKYAIAAGHVSREPWEPGKNGVYPTKAYDFDEPGYRPGDTLAQRNAALAKIDSISKGGVATDKKYSEMNNVELSREHGVLSRLQMHLDAGGAALAPGERIALIQRDEPGLTPTPALGNLMRSPENINRQLEMVHRARAVNLDVPEGERGIKAQEMPPGDIVVTGALAPVEERKDDQERVKRSVGGALASMQQAIDFYTPRGANGAAAADALATAKLNLEEHQDLIATQEDWDQFREMEKDAFDILNDLPNNPAWSAHWTQKEQAKGQLQPVEKPKKEPGGGSILS